MVFSKLSKTVKTEIIENIPMVIPNNESRVLTLLTTRAFMAKRKLSTNNFTTIIKRN
jgi:hypothetical protein